MAGIPTRGLVFSKTIDTVLANKPDKLVFSHSKPVPEAYNHLVDLFLESRATHLWFIDDDMLLPKTILDDMLLLDTDVAMCDYPLETGNSAQYLDGEFSYGGMGCVLVKRKVFESGIRFRTHIGYKLPNLTPIERDPDFHGGQDVDFFVQCRERGFNIKVAGKVGHLRIKGIRPVGNNTAFNVEVL